MKIRYSTKILQKFVLKTIKGIDRPAIAGILPTMKGQPVVLDLGANVDCPRENLVQFALMGDVFSRIVIGIKNPVLGLLNVGSEQIKGNSIVKQTFEDLKNISSKFKPSGNGCVCFSFNFRLENPMKVCSL